MPPIAASVRLQAAHWLVELQGDSVACDTLRRWREWRAADPEHERAWQHIEGFQYPEAHRMLQTLVAVP